MRPCASLDADPVPSDGVLGHHLARPLVVEPGPAPHVARTLGDDDASAHRELRPAVVPARLMRQRALARVALVALQQHRLRGLELEFEREVARGDRRDVAPAFQRERPVADPRPGRRLVRAGEVEHRARRTLVVAQPAVRGVRHRRVREHELPCGEPARVVLGDARAVAEERHLHAERGAVAALHPAGRVPPLGAVVGMAAVVAREAQRGAGQHRRVAGGRPGRRRQGRGDERQGEERAPPHQSSFTARTASTPIACPQGTSSSMPQWNDWRLTT